MEPKPGDRVEIETEEKKVSGILMPSRHDDTIVLKLSSGYNTGISKKKIKSMKVAEQYKKEKSEKEYTIGHNKSLPVISILHTGGTIASKVDYKTGGVISTFTPEDILSMFPKLRQMANIHSRLISNMWSEDMRFKHYALMAKAIKEEIEKGVKGVILTHGTDTLHYTSAALSFMLQNLPVPVILVGSQRSSDRGSSDANMNLTCAIDFIAKADFAGVAICMHETSNDEACAILPGTKTRKLHTSRRDAFRPVNASPIARINYKTGKIEFLVKEYQKADKKKKPEIKAMMEEKVAMIKTHPNMFPEQFECYKGYKGLVIEGTGLGQAPIDVFDEFTKMHKDNFNAIKRLIDSGCIVVMASQCIFGRVHMHVYSGAIELANIGIIPAEDMTPETAFIKLAWLLGNYKKDEAKKLFAQNIAGEISERALYDEELLEFK